MKNAIRIIKRYEGLRVAAYAPPEGTDNGYAIGYGYTRKWVTKYCMISEAWADELLREQLEVISKDLHRVLPFGLNSNQVEALTSLVYNIGIMQFKNSTLFRKLLAGDITGAAQEFLRWNKSKGVQLPGLTKRRADERDLFLLPTR